MTEGRRFYGSLALAMAGALLLLVAAGFGSTRWAAVGGVCYVAGLLVGPPGEAVRTFFGRRR